MLGDLSNFSLGQLAALSKRMALFDTRLAAEEAAANEHRRQRKSATKMKGQSDGKRCAIYSVLAGEARVDRVKRPGQPDAMSASAAAVAVAATVVVARELRWRGTTS